MSEKKSRNKGKFALLAFLAVLILVLLLFAVYLALYDGMGLGRSLEVSTTATAVYDDSEAGTTQADVTYKAAEEVTDKSLEDVAGTYATLDCVVKTVDETAIGYVDVTPVDNVDQTIACYFPDATDEAMMKLALSLKIGDKVTISGQFMEEQTGTDGTLKFNVDSLKLN